MQPVTLFQAPTRPWKTPNLSPFCIKLECYLRMTGIEHKVAPMSRSQSPRGKIPYVEVGGKLIADSQHIIDHFEKELGERALDHGLSPSDAAVGRMVRRTLEEGFYWTGMYLRWATDEGYPVMKDAFKAFVPGFVVPLVRRDILKKLHAQGTGRHTREEIEAMGAADLEAVADVLGTKPFLFGDAPRTVDCVVFAFLEAALGFPKETLMSRRVAARGNLISYRDRIRERWWKDLA